jgi:hypothetical protein
VKPSIRPPHTQLLLLLLLLRLLLLLPILSPVEAAAITAKAPAIMTRCQTSHHEQCPHHQGCTDCTLLLLCLLLLLVVVQGCCPVAVLRV